MPTNEKSDYTLSEIYKLLGTDGVKISDKYAYSNKKTKNKSVNLSVGRIWINTVLPDDFRLIDEVINKTKLDKLMQEIIAKYPPDKASDIVSRLQKEAFKLSSINPRSFRIDAFIFDPEWIKKRAEFKKRAVTLSDEDFLKEAKELTQELFDDLNEKDIGIQDVISSGTKGGLADWNALMVSRGFVVDLEGNVSKIIDANNDGLSIGDYYKAGAQGRRSQFIKTEMTSKPGYLARRVTIANANIKITEDDCGTKHFMPIFVESGRANMFIGRNYISGTKLKTVESPDEIINKNIKFRSPLFCKSEKGICKTCYGKLHEKVNSKNIGILAGGAINNETVNAMMKLRHKATQVDIVKVDFKDYLKQAGTDITLLKKFVDIQPTELIAKKEVVVHIDSKDYHKDTIVEFVDKYQLPGILDLTVGEGDLEENITLPFSFNIDLMKPHTIEEKGTLVTMIFQKGETIIFKDQYIKELNPAIIDRLFEGGIRYITDPILLLNAITQELPKTDNVHIELVVSNMFRSDDDPTVPGRLINYKKCSVLGCKKLPFIDSWVSALAFQDINKAIKTGLIQNKDAVMNPIESIVLNEHWGEQSSV